tara:strand:- start:173089 stop:173499 length:411 start_codon:yes stop_codon:yes gene_type:complete
MLQARVAIRGYKMGSDITKGTLLECRTILLNKKSDILNQLQNVRRELEERRQDTSGDEIDQSLTVLAENQMLSATQRLRGLLVEIEAALHRIETGHFGICEETEEPIEADRLKAIPWTRLSIEGAEIRDAMKSKFA